MSSFEENDDLWFQIYSNYPDQEKTTQLQDQSKIDVCKRFGEGQPVPDANDHTCFNKKVIHREIEKQRRKKMAALSSSLRSLLPPELVKGKRSVGDHINEATKYIKHLEKKIKDSGAKRDRLQSLSISSTTTSCGHGNGSSSNCSANYVTVCCRSMGQVEVILSTGGGFDPGKSQLSSVLKLLLEEGLSVVSCVSTKVNERLLHTIQSQIYYQPTMQGRNEDLLEEDPIHGD
ncbi:hypothetical protein RHMOL_Rhmol03G0201600 [Rhododendron molle]|uniref:Uncharacterized protein n=1 Tax=Rhododendron molle TaxID=49168 RepID=A0ACC0PHS7_RHOML|nr:hypothetical protein RHMOL_Rhmol03G0201600 [Rhododendron molle]